MNLKSTIRNILIKNGHTHEITGNLSFSASNMSKVNDKIYGRLFNNLFGGGIAKLCNKMIEKNTIHRRLTLGPEKFILDIHHKINDDIGYFYKITNSEIGCFYCDDNTDSCTALKIDSLLEEEKFEFMLTHPALILDFASTEFVGKVRKLAKKNTKYYISINDEDDS